MFVTGVPRCGSSWIGEVLGGLPGVRYNYEPLNPNWVPALKGTLHHFLYMGPDANPGPDLEQALRRAFSSRVSAKQLVRATYRGYVSSALRFGGRMLVKDPTASLMTAWIARRTGALPVIVIRHPCGFVSSVRRLDWRMSVRPFLRQQALMSDHLCGFEGVMKRAEGDPWATLAVIWSVVHRVLLDQVAENPGWCVLFYEDMCRNPLAGFRALARSVDLPWSSAAERRVSGRSNRHRSDPGSTLKKSNEMPDVWKERLTQAEADTILEVCDQFGFSQYPLKLPYRPGVQ